MKTRELVKLIKEDGWYFVRQGGTSHMIYHHENKSGIVVVPNHGMNQDVPVGLANAILKQAGLK